MNPEDIGKILDEIGERVGPLGSAAWEILVQGTFAVSLVGTIAGVLLFVGGLYTALKLHRYGYSTAYDERYGGKSLTDSGTFAVVAAWFVGIVLPIAGLFAFTHSLVGVIAPEFRVLENLIKSIQ